MAEMDAASDEDDNASLACLGRVGPVIQLQLASSLPTFAHPLCFYVCLFVLLVFVLIFSPNALPFYLALETLSVTCFVFKPNDQPPPESPLGGCAPPTLLPNVTLVENSFAAEGVKFRGLEGASNSDRGGSGRKSGGGRGKGDNDNEGEGSSRRGLASPQDAAAGSGAAVEIMDDVSLLGSPGNSIDGVGDGTGT